jgi:hypothetical protein
VSLVILAGTRKGRFLLRGEDDRRTWEVEGPLGSDSQVGVVAAVAGGCAMGITASPPRVDSFRGCDR